MKKNQLKNCDVCVHVCCVCLCMCNMNKNSSKKITEEKAEWKTGSIGYFEFLLQFGQGSRDTILKQATKKEAEKKKLHLDNL